MPKITGGAIAAIVAGTVILGGAGIGTAIAVNQDDEPASTPTPTISETAEADAPTPEATSPLVAETPDATPPADADAAFLAYVRGDLLPTSGITDASDADLIAAGHVACDQLADGVAFEDVRVVEGEKPGSSGAYYDTSSIMNGAVVNYCPEFLPPPSEN